MANIDNVQLPDGSSYNIVDNTSGFATQNYVNSAVDSITKTTIGLGNVDNTSDLDKPVSTEQQTAIDNAVAPKANQTLLAPVESTTTASRTYQIDDQFVYNGLLYKATAVINSGGTITVGGNCTLSNNVTKQIKNLKGYTKSFMPIFGTTAGRGTITDALEVDTLNADGNLNRVGYVITGTSYNIPSDLAFGIREVLYWNSTQIWVKITGMNSDNYPCVWFNYYNGSDWLGWEETLIKGKNGWKHLATITGATATQIQDIGDYDEIMACMYINTGNNTIRTVTFLLPTGNMGGYLELNPYFYSGGYFGTSSFTSGQLQFNGSTVKPIQIAVNGTSYTSGFETRVFGR